MKIAQIFRIVILLATILMAYSSAKDDPEVNWRDNPNTDIEYHKLTDHPLFGRQLSNTYTLNDIDTMLVSMSYMNRGLAAMILANGSVADTARCVGQLVKALTGEINHPFSNEIANEVNLPITDFLKNQFRAAIRFLLYKKGSSLIAEYIEKEEGNAKSMLIVVAGILGDKSVKREIRDIYIGSEDGYIRSAAVEAMNMFPDSLDIPALRVAIKDNYFTKDKYGNNIYQIRGTAIGALSKLGFSVEEIDKMINSKD